MDAHRICAQKPARVSKLCTRCAARVIELTGAAGSKIDNSMTWTGLHAVNAGSLRGAHGSCATNDLLRGGFFSRGDTELFRPLIDGLLRSDPYFVVADYASYAACQDRVSQAYGDHEQWARMSILNAASSGRFSSDRTIREYCSDIWKVSPVPIRLLSQDEVKAGFLQ